MQDMMITRMNEVVVEALGNSCLFTPQIPRLHMQMDWFLKRSFDHVSPLNFPIGAKVIVSVVALIYLPSLTAFV